MIFFLMKIVSISILHGCKVGNTRRVLARILKMPVQNNNSKISDRPDLATKYITKLGPWEAGSFV